MNRMIRAVFGAAAGALAGYGWHRLVGCSGGACPITANPYISALVGALLGLTAALG